MISLSLVLLLNAQPPLVFDEDGNFIVVDRDAKPIERLRKVCGLTPVELAASPDGSEYAFSSWSEPVQNWLLYRCERKTGTEPQLLGEAQGYHGHPAFSPDGKWVYFSHHPKKGGPPGQHEEGANAQLYRVRRDGAGLEALSDSRGCKLGPKSAGADLLVYVHLSCIGPRAIELMSGGRVTVLTGSGRMPHYPDVTSDGRRLLFTEQLIDATRVVEMDLKSRREVVLLTLPPGLDRMRASWAKNDSTVLFQREGAIWSWQTGHSAPPSRLFEIGGGQ